MRFAHLVAGHLILPSLEKQELLEATGATEQLELLQECLVRELEIMRIEAKLDRQIQLQLGSERAPDVGTAFSTIHREPAEDEDAEWREIEEAVHSADLPPHAQERAHRELSRLKKLNPVAPEAAVIRSHLDWIVALPWAARSADNLSVEHASRILESEHFGLGEVKERILDHVAVLSLVKEMRGPILCLVGPPGVGKTSLGRSIAQALGREFVRVSLGGVRDEAEIRGHRRTYVGALPGRIVQGMRRSGTRNPVFLLDEVDKIAQDFHGDPGAALLEVLDPEQNRTFSDHYLELEYDLSEVLFITTANTLQGIPEPLRDRMEIIRLPGYLDTEKREIASRFLWPKQAERHGLAPGALSLSNATIHDVILRYTREAGVRELDRRLARIARKVARGVADGVAMAATLEPEGLKDLLGPPPYSPTDRDEDSERIGIANGLAWTAAGGEVLDVEVAVIPGGGELRLTGTLGDVMKESAHAAVTYARSRSELLGLDPQFHSKIDVHIHIPEGATPKDGPSAGITIAVALISALMGRPTRADVAMTGEITLRGRGIGRWRNQGESGRCTQERHTQGRASGRERVGPGASARRGQGERGVRTRTHHGRGDGRGTARQPPPPPSGVSSRWARNAAPPRMKIKTVEYAGTIAQPGGASPAGASTAGASTAGASSAGASTGTRPQIAFSGRSNVGKSSLINTLLRRTRKKIARVSATPGKTRTINFFLVNERFFLVDLPGYGYAKVPKAMREAWSELIEWYLSASGGVQGLVHLMDARRDPTDHDLNMITYLSELGVPTFGRAHQDG